MAKAMNDMTNLAHALQRVTRHFQAGRFQDAIDLTLDIEAERGGLAEAQHLRGLATYALGDKDQGLELVKDAASFLADNGGIQADIGALLAQEGKLQDAVPYFERATELAPNYAGAWTNLGAALFLMEEYSAAIAPLRKAVALDPQLVDAQRNLGTALSQAHRYKDAIAAFYRALAIDPNDVGLHVSISAALYRDERHDTALYHANKALEIEPRSVQAHFHIGNALASLGKMNEAEEHLLKAANVMPIGVNALYRLIHLRKTKQDSPEFQRLSALLSTNEERLKNPHRSSLHFAAGKAFRDLGDFEKSFEHLSKGNAITAADHPFNLANHVEQVDRMIAVVTPALIAKHRGQAGVTDIAPIFVCGMPRSGTTLTELMLSRHPHVRAGGELNASRFAFGRVRRLVDHLEERDDAEISADEVSQVGEFYSEALLKEGLVGEIITDKLPLNYLYVGLLALALPRARFLVLRRHPMDCCLSNWSQDFGRNQSFSTQFETLGAVYRHYKRITDYWMYLLPDRTRVLHYEDLVSDPETEMRRCLEFCGLPWDDAVLDPAGSSRAVNTASIAQVRRPVNRDSVAAWHHYGASLRPLAEALGDLLDAPDRRVAGLPG